MLTLYHAPNTRSVRPRWMLEELGVPHDIIRIDMAAGGHKQPAYLAVNPCGAVPAIVDGDLRLFESAAICQHLADKHSEHGMAPAIGTPQRALYYQWIHYAMSGLEPPAEAIFMHTIMRPEDRRIPAIVAESRPRLACALDIVDHALEGREFIVGDRLTAADIMVGHTLAWASMFYGRMPPNVTAYVARLTARPAWQRALAD